MKFFFPYIGGKIKDMKFIKSYVNLTDIDTICEPFCGSFAFSRTFNDKMKILNDTDKNLIQLYKDVQKGKMQEYVNYVNIEYPKIIADLPDKSKWNEIRRTYMNDIKMWYLYMVTKSQNGIRLHEKKQNIEDYTDAIKALENTELICSDYSNIFEKVKNDSRCFVFLDPPYFDSFNKSYSSFDGKTCDKNMVIQDRTQIYIDILNFLKCAKCRVMLIINKNSIIEYIYKDFIKGEYGKYYDFSGRHTTHLIVTNY